MLLLNKITLRNDGLPMQATRVKVKPFRIPHAKEFTSTYKFAHFTFFMILQWKKFM